jgi:hypothetical protein
MVNVDIDNVCSLFELCFHYLHRNRLPFIDKPQQTNNIRKGSFQNLDSPGSGCTDTVVVRKEKQTAEIDNRT